MTIEEARKLLWEGTVTIERSCATWTGTVVGIVESPALILEHENGRRSTIVLSGAAVTRDSQPTETES